MFEDNAVLGLPWNIKSCPTLTSAVASFHKVKIKSSVTGLSRVESEVSGWFLNTAFSFLPHNGESVYRKPFCSMLLFRNTSAGWGEQTDVTRDSIVMFLWHFLPSMPVIISRKVQALYLEFPYSDWVSSLFNSQLCWLPKVLSYCRSNQWPTLGLFIVHEISGAAVSSWRPVGYF